MGSLCSKSQGPAIDETSSALSTIQIVLLGSGSVGKSTLLRQFMINYKDDITRELTTGAQTARENLWNAVDQLTQLSSMETEEGMICKTRTKQLVAYHKEKNDLYFPSELTAKEIDAISGFWSDEGTKKAYNEHINEIIEPGKYFLDNADRICATGCSPEDFLWIRRKTVGIVTVEMQIDGVPTKVTDTGGERNERRKWPHVFNNESTYVYIVDLSSYDKTLYEDDTTNRVTEALDLWRELQRHPILRDQPFYLIFNKKDVFAQKIANKDLKECFPEYEGGCNYETALQYFLSQFEPFDSKKVKTFVTNMIDKGDAINLIQTILKEQKA